MEGGVHCAQSVLVTLVRSMVPGPVAAQTSIDQSVFICTCLICLIVAETLNFIFHTVLYRRTVHPINSELTTADQKGSVRLSLTPRLN